MSYCRLSEWLAGEGQRAAGVTVRVDAVHAG